MYAGIVRTTLTLDPDVAARLAEVQRERGWTFKEAVNQMLRRGLGAGAGGEGPYQMPVRELGVREGVDVDRIRDELSALDDDSSA
jgi:hypothetical protein